MTDGCRSSVFHHHQPGEGQAGAGVGIVLWPGLLLCMISNLSYEDSHWESD